MIQPIWVWIGRALKGRRDVTLYNLGVRRETSADIAARWEAEVRPRWVDYEPMRIVLSCGINDCHPDGDGEARVRVAMAQTLANIEDMLAKASTYGQVLLVGPPPVVSPGVMARLEVLNGHLGTRASQWGAPFIDVLHPLAASGVWQAEASTWDGAHPGAAGYQQMADLVLAHPAWQAFVRA